MQSMPTTSAVDTNGSQSMAMTMADPIGIPMTRTGSGTTWLPDRSPMHAKHLTAGDWEFMLHGVAFVQFEDWPHAFIVAGSSVVVATLVGNIFSTWLASRQTRMNTTAAFVGLLFFGWIWGLWGLLLGIPILAIVKTICDHNEDWKGVAELLGQ